MFKKDLPISAKKILELDVRIINTLIMSEFDQDFLFLSDQSFPGDDSRTKNGLSES